MVLVTEPYTLIKTHQTVHFHRVTFTINYTARSLTTPSSKKTTDGGMLKGTRANLKDNLDIKMGDDNNGVTLWVKKKQQQCIYTDKINYKRGGRKLFSLL